MLNASHHSSPNHADGTPNPDGDVIRRPRVKLAKLLRANLACPLCRLGSVRTLSFGTRTVRFRCKKCGLRFTLTPRDVGRALVDHAEAIADRLTDHQRVALAVYRDPFRRIALTPEQQCAEAVEAIRDRGADLLAEIERVETRDGNDAA